jgi:tRNA (guanine-N7-)-methyltransferase
VRPFNATAFQGPSRSFLPAPWPLVAGPLDLEIGCGAGWHPIHYASTFPDRRLIAIEHTRTKFAKFSSRLKTHPELNNLWAVHADAIRWVSDMLPPNSIDRCFLWYPNPEPKAVNKRWLRSPFMHRLLETLKNSGELHLATNDVSYFNEALKWAEKCWQLESLFTRSFDKSVESHPRTHFERKYLLRGDTCFEVHWMKPLIQDYEKDNV